MKIIKNEEKKRDKFLVFGFGHAFSTIHSAGIEYIYRKSVFGIIHSYKHKFNSIYSFIRGMLKRVM